AACRGGGDGRASPTAGHAGVAWRRVLREPDVPAGSPALAVGAGGDPGGPGRHGKERATVGRAARGRPDGVRGCVGLDLLRAAVGGRWNRRCDPASERGRRPERRVPGCTGPPSPSAGAGTDVKLV